MSSQLLNIGAGITTFLGLVGLAVVAVLLAHLRRARTIENALKAVPARQRAQLVDPLLSRYNLKADGLSEDATVRLLLAEMDKQHKRVRLGAVIVILTILAAVAVQFRLEGTFPAKTGDLSAIFGQRAGVDRVRSVPRDGNSGLLKSWFAKSENNIKILAMNGSSWIFPNLLDVFKRSAARITLTLLIYDYSDPRAALVFNDAMNEYGEGIWTPDQFKDYFQRYADNFKSSDRFALGLWNDYPWTRFTIFDDKAVSFIITPHVDAGDNVQPYFSEDPFIVRCFEEIFRRSMENAQKRGRMFTNAAEADQFIKAQPDR